MGKRENRYQPWEDDLIRKHWRSASGRKLLLELLPHREPKSLRNRAPRLGVRAKGAEWTLAEDKILRRCHPDLAKAELRLPGRSRCSIYNRSCKLGLRTMRRWSKAEDHVVDRLAPTHTDRQVALMLGRTVAAVEGRREHLGIVKRPHRVAATPVVADVIAEASVRGVKLQTLTRALGCQRIISGQNDRHVSHEAIAKVVSVFGGHLYAEWDD
ncbi:hypothetical protein [Devosia sp. Root635]|uniref:hypothetical protein n=1 Tax=Devosia sp. Root635 TaxID=1736575 RepID=UPI0006F563AB|nr:hypothetical protein [Devosia sp. Root635]KRA42063.1 hypothetical protein ASD80_10070 [Devosia sp. Root635]